jgi:hypothetical protein
MYMTLYQKFSTLKDEIMKHKWIESEKNNNDIGFETALIDWTKKYQKQWIVHQKNLDKSF